MAAITAVPIRHPKALLLILIQSCMEVKRAIEAQIWLSGVLF